MTMIEESQTVSKKNSGGLSQQSNEIQTTYNLSPKNYSDAIFPLHASGMNVQLDKNSQAA